MRMLIPIVCVLASVAQAGTHEDRVNEAWRRVFFIESSNGKNPAAFVENSVGALGVAQITRIVVADVNRIVKCPAFCLADRMNTKASREMFDITMAHYYPSGTVEQMCRLWYRGPNRRRQNDKHGDRYWQQCQKVK